MTRHCHYIKWAKIATALCAVNRQILLYPVYAHHATAFAKPFETISIRFARFIKLAEFSICARMHWDCSLCHPAFNTLNVDSEPFDELWVIEKHACLSVLYHKSHLEVCIAWVELIILSQWLLVVEDVHIWLVPRQHVLQFNEGKEKRYADNANGEKCTCLRSHLVTTGHVKRGDARPKNVKTFWEFQYVAHTKLILWSVSWHYADFL